MALISKQKLDKKLYQELFDQLVELQSNLDKTKSKALLESLLTDTEQVMLTKRCAAILMLGYGYTPYKVWSRLKLSSSTVARLQQDLDAGEYDELLKLFRPKRDKGAENEEFVLMLEKILRLGMPPMGKDRWQFLDSNR